MNTYNSGNMNENHETTSQSSYLNEDIENYEQGSYIPPVEPEKKKKKKILFWLLFLIALSVLLYSGFQLFKILKANWDEKRELDRITEIANIPKDPEAPFTVNWEELRNVNSDIVAWMIVPNTNISYPVVQGKDNDYYLSNTFAKEYNYAGSIFVDFNNKGDFSDNNTFIYGHNTRHGTMFGELEKFTDKEFFDEQQYVYLFTPEKNYRAEIISFYETKSGTRSYRYGISDPTQWKEYLDLIRSSEAYVKANVGLGESDRIISLSTCSYQENGELTDARYLLHAKLVPWIGEYKTETTE